mmetsp:Transcript_32067/g.70196  ORF Transcript_32067/g.70196 Transcript_32067/m.70196 type:complete len:248 (+) Transcript_32067:4572-5315(+)
MASTVPLGMLHVKPRCPPFCEALYASLASLPQPWLRSRSADGVLAIAPSADPDSISSCCSHERVTRLQLGAGVVGPAFRMASTCTSVHATSAEVQSMQTAKRIIWRGRPHILTCVKSLRLGCAICSSRALHAPSTALSLASVYGMTHSRLWTLCGIGNALTVKEVTMPGKLPPPPRAIQNISALVDASAARSAPFSSMYSSPVITSQKRPWIVVLMPRPQPSRRPEAPTPLTLPPGTASWCPVASLW